MLAGQYPSQTGIYHNTGVLPEDKTTWASVLRDNGYMTACVGRAHGIDQGFQLKLPIPFGDSFFDMSSRLNAPRGDWSYDHWDYRSRPHVYEGDFEQYMDVRCANTACHVMRDMKDYARPWAMYVGFLAPHNPYILPRKYAGLYAPEDFDLPPVFEEDFHKPCYTQGKKEFWDQFTERNIRETRAFYYAMVTMVDELLGRLLDQLDDLGLTDDTLVILTSDHGEMNGDHGMFTKINFYDESIRIPGVVACPGRFDGGRESDAMVEGVDFLPTMLDLAGIESPPSAAGRSFLGLLEGRTDAHRDFICSAYEEGHNFMRCVRTREHRYSYGYPTDEGLTGELYDLRTDPDQRYNVYNDPASRDVRETLMRTMLECELDHSHRLHSQSGRADRPDLKWRFPESHHLH